MSASEILKNLPRYLWEYTVGLLLALVNDFVLTSILFAAIASGFWLGVAAGFTIFFVLYVFLRVIGNVAEAVGFGLNSVGNNLGSNNTVTFNQPPASEIEVIENATD